MKKNIYIKILLLFIGTFVRLQASASNTAQQASEGDMVQAALLNQNKNLKSIRAIAELTGNLNQINIVNKDNESLIAEYFYFITAYDKILKNYSQDPSFDALKALFESKITTYTNLQVVKKYLANESKLDSENLKKQLDNTALNVPEENEESLFRYIYLKNLYNGTVKKHGVDKDLEQNFKTVIDTYTNLEIVKKYNNYQVRLAAFFKNPTLETAEALQEATTDELIKKYLTQPSTEAILKAVLSRNDLDPLVNLMIKNITEPTQVESQVVQKYAQAIESLFKTFDLRLDVSKVENFLETGTLPKDRWFKNVFTKMKRAFGLSKDVDIVDVTNLLKNLNRDQLISNQYSRVTLIEELQAALLKDPALMYKLLPEKAKSFIKQFDNIKGFKNKLLEAYFKDKAEYDESFKDGVAEVTRAAGLTKLIKAAVALSLDSDQKDTIVAALDINFSDYAQTKYSGFDLQAALADGFKLKGQALPPEMQVYFDTLTTSQRQTGFGGGYEWSISEDNDPAVGKILGGDTLPRLGIKTGTDIL